MKPNCDLVRRDGGIVCLRCGYRRASYPEDWPLTQRVCGDIGPPPDTVKPPSFWKKVANFARASVKQAPLFAEAVLTLDESKACRSEEEMAQIIELCKACDYYRPDADDPESGACGHPDCGCPIDKTRGAFWSKVGWRSAHCPLKPPKW